MSDTMTSRGVSMFDDPRLGPTRIKPVSRKEAVRIEIRRSIITGVLLPGEKLTETQLSTALGVSRPTVREALNALAEEGFIVKEPYRGLRVAEMRSDEVHDMAVTRNALDMVAIDAILADESGTKFAIVEDAWDHYSSEAFDADPVVQHDAHMDFHHAVWEASGNFLLNKLWPVTAAQMTIGLSEDRRQHQDPHREFELHERLMKALRTRDREVIMRAFSDHTLVSANELYKRLKAEGK
ncbi:GntR family transcriptional regulator [Leucobacter sp. GX24907]